MRLRIDELKEAWKDTTKQYLSYQTISDETGIRRGTLHSLNSGDSTLVRLQYIDALFTFFKTELSELTPIDLIECAETQIPVSAVRNN